jgi:hypothetical protein
MQWCGVCAKENDIEYLVALGFQVDSAEFPGDFSMSQASYENS